MELGVIADDFTGGTDIAGFLVQNGLHVTQYLGVPARAVEGSGPEAGVISLKSRSCPVGEAVRDSLAALRWLKAQGCRQIYFKYCSTFDSTEKGNIGPVADALMLELASEFTVLAPALPVNGRTVYCGYLFVNAVPLDESGMRNHPVTPMRDANLMRLIEAQAQGKAANVPYAVVKEGGAAILEYFATLRSKGVAYAVPDALEDTHLDNLAEAVADFPLVTGGSGLGAGLARRIAKRLGLDGAPATDNGRPVGGRCVVLAGSASVMTNAQVAAYRSRAQSLAVDVRTALSDGEEYAQTLADWAFAHSDAPWAPLIYATADPDTLAAVQAEFGAEASGRAVEDLFARIAAALGEKGVDHFIVAGGETSGSVVKALGIQAFHIGPQIAPGVPWVRAVEKPVYLALKSGNFGDADFFSTAQEFFS